MRTVSERFWAKVDKSGECWLWTAAKTRYGYGDFGVSANKTVRAHRWAYEEARGPIPAELVIDHLCRNPPCVNPAHLEAVTNKENILRGTSPSARYAVATHCVHNHVFDAENTVYLKNGKRKCRECHKASNKRLRAQGAKW